MWLDRESNRLFGKDFADASAENQKQILDRIAYPKKAAKEDSPWVAGDWLFVISSDQLMGAVNRLDGRIAWVTDLPRWGDAEKQQDPIFWFGPLLAGDRLIAAGTSEELISVSPYDGKILGHQKLSGPASLGPIAAGGTVFVMTDDGRLLALA